MQLETNKFMCQRTSQECDSCHIIFSHATNCAKPIIPIKICSHYVRPNKEFHINFMTEAKYMVTNSLDTFMFYRASH